VITIAITPSLKASRRFFGIPLLLNGMPYLRDLVFDLGLYARLIAFAGNDGRGSGAAPARVIL
jgi:hypothetical protein